MSSYTKWDRGAYIDRVGGEEEAERRRKALMARQSGQRLAEERKRHGLTQAQLAHAMGVTPGRVSQIERGELATIDAVAATSKHSAASSTWSPASATTPLPSPLPKPHKQICVQCPLPEPQHFSRLPDVAEPSDADLDALVEQATVDAYDEYEQLASLHAVIKEHLAVPFRTTVLGVEVTVTKIDLLSGSGIAAICSRGKHRQAIGILDLPLPAPPPAGAEWIDAYRHWAT